MNSIRALIEGVTNIPGLNITGTIVPCTEDDKYGTHDSQYGIGGWHEVRTLAERDAIPMQRRRLGMVAYVTTEGKQYVLKNSLYNTGWVCENSVDASDIINKAIQQGTINVDLTGLLRESDLYTVLEQFYDKADVDDIIERLADDLKQWVEEKQYLTEHQSLENYSTTEEIAEQYYNKEQVNELHTGIVDEWGNWVNGDLNDRFVAIEEDITDIKDNYVTKEELEDKGYVNNENVQEIVANAGFVTAEQLTEATQDLITRDEVQAIVDTDVVKMADFLNTLDNLVTKEQLAEGLETRLTNAQLVAKLENAGFLTVEDLRGYATEAYVRDYLRHEGYLKVSDLRGYATEAFVIDYINRVLGR